MFKFSQRSINNLSKVHPDLVWVMARALYLSKYDFTVTEGVRTIERQRQLLAQGKSKTLKSYHLPHNDGYSWACDIAIWSDGKITWDEKYYAIVAHTVLDAASDIGVDVECGAFWTSFVDGPHMQIRNPAIPPIYPSRCQGFPVIRCGVLLPGAEVAK